MHILIHKKLKLKENFTELNFCPKSIYGRTTQNYSSEPQSKKKI